LNARVNSPLRRIVLGEASWLRVLRSALIIYIVILAYAWFQSNRIIFPAPPSSYRDGPDILRVRVSGDASIAALYLPNPAARFVILHSHGNYEDLGTVREGLEEWRRWGFGVFAYDYRGYGLSDGQPGERYAYADAEAAYRHLTGTMGIAPGRVIVHGRSVGAALAIHLAAQFPVAGLIAESGFVTAFRVKTRIPVAPFDRFRNIDKIPRVRCPVLIIHGTGDDLVPLWHGQALYAVAREPKLGLWVKGAGHNDLGWVAGDTYRAAVAELVRLIPEAGAPLASGGDGTPDPDSPKP
jgi:hypothetical protein